jgi:hypothetical protein
MIIQTILVVLGVALIVILALFNEHDKYGDR